jgi:UDPglucose 6-dehydrogenase
MRIAMIGAGYVGLVSGACLAEAGHTVIAVDSYNARIADLKAGRMPIYEPGLAELVAQNVAAGRLSFTSDLAMAVAASQVTFIAVGTPEGHDGRADLSAVMSVARQIAAVPADHRVVVVKSTVPVGTGDRVLAAMLDIAPNGTVDVVSNPEFLREGSAITDFWTPDRVVIGAESPLAFAVMREVYAKQLPLLVEVDRRTSELTKYAANAFLAMKLAFVNEISDLCEAFGASIEGVVDGIGRDPRIGDLFLSPGPGFGGSCFPKDTLALVRMAQDVETPVALIDTTIAVNDARKRAMGYKVIEACGGDVVGKRIAILGLTFKAGTDDMRASPAIDIIDVLQEAGADIDVYDPKGMRNAARCLDGVVFCDSAIGAAAFADAVVIATEWPEFAALDLKTLRAAMGGGEVLVDLRNIISPEAARAAGFTYSGIGRS